MIPHHFKARGDRQVISPGFSPAEPSSSFSRLSYYDLSLQESDSESDPRKICSSLDSSPMELETSKLSIDRYGAAIEFVRIQVECGFKLSAQRFKLKLVDHSESVLRCAR